LRPEVAAARTASAMEGFAKRLLVLSCKKIVISSSHCDSEWMKAIRSALNLYVDPDLWDDSQIQPDD
jgi:hypothetical protein